MGVSMLIFIVGSVISSEAVCVEGAEQVPCFRTPEFYEMMFWNKTFISL